MVAILIFAIAVGMAALAIWLFLYAGRRERKEDVLVRLRTGDEQAAAAWVSRDAKLRNPLLRWACHALWRSGSDAEPEAVSKILLVLGAMVPVTILLFGFAGGLAVIGFAAAFGFVILTRAAARRRAQIVQQMPAYLEGVIRVLSAGNTLEEALAAAAREAPDPIRPLFTSVGRQVRLGAPVEVVLTETAEIHRIRMLKVVALAASVNRKFGGSLRNVIRSLIQAIRNREMTARELRALTAETRFSAMILAVIPVAVTLFIFIRNRPYYADIWADMSGRITLIIAIVLQVVGVFVIYSMLRSTEDEG